jgi:hypothetical protein
MRYNVSLGMLATEAMTELTKAEINNSADNYRRFLEKTAEFCKSLRRSYGNLSIDPATLPPPAVSFLSAVMATQPQTQTSNTKLEVVNNLEPLISSILSQQRIPTADERLKIAQALYDTSAADPR